ncbi:MAG: hypothetical protein WEE36_11315 [Acidimicrobiia bacterium]
MRRILAMAGVVVLLAAGCSSIGRVHGPVLTSPNPGPFGGGGMDALIQGMLIFDDASGCLLVGREGAGYPVVWPAGASWQTDPSGVRLAGGELVEPGMWVTGGGGYLQQDDIERMAGSEVAAAAAACVGPTGEIIIFNAGSTVVVSTEGPGETAQWRASDPPAEFASGLRIDAVPLGYHFTHNQGHETAVFHVFVSEDGETSFSVGRYLAPYPYEATGREIELGGRVFVVNDEIRIFEHVAEGVRIEVISQTLAEEWLLPIAESVTYEAERDSGGGG